MKYNNRDEYQGGNFYLLDLVGADYATQAQFVKKIEEEEKQQQVPIEQMPSIVESEEGLGSPRTEKVGEQRKGRKKSSKIVNNSRI